jgi:hypothetical protein
MQNAAKAGIGIQDEYDIHFLPIVTEGPRKNPAPWVGKFKNCQYCKARLCLTWQASFRGIRGDGLPRVFSLS